MFYMHAVYGPSQWTLFVVQGNICRIFNKEINIEYLFPGPSSVRIGPYTIKQI